ncbi:MAG: isoamylase early set domain-containing protein [Pseudomonadales bacterium]
MLDKRYLADGKTCKVTFTIDHGAVAEADHVSLVGEFNDWDASVNPMKRRKSGAFSTAVKLPCGHSYQFRYLVDDALWENDAAADGYVPTPYGSDNSIVEVATD